MEILPKTVDDRGAGPVRRAAGPTSGYTPVGGVGPVEAFKADFDELGFFEGGGDVGVHARAEVLDGGGIVEGLALFVGGVELGVEGFEVAELDFGGFDVFEEAVKVGAAGGHLDAVGVWRRRLVLLPEMRERSAE